MQLMALTRDEFRNIVLKRDNYRCVFCQTNINTVAHHIMERRLFAEPSFGYFKDNGATVCTDCHYKCETTEISTEEVRAACNIKNTILPPHLYNDNEYTYDKWGNIVLSNGNRLKGELFYDESVQKILKLGDKLKLFLPYIKYPRTQHCLWSEKLGKDDRIISSMSAFENKRVIVSEKSDGSNFSLYNNYCHGRSIDAKPRFEQSWVRNFWSTIKHDIPDGWRICGEDLYRKHTIYYDNLSSFFLGFSIWNEKNECLSWDDTLEWFQLIGITPVNVLYDNIYNEEKIIAMWKSLDTSNVEGYVVRVAENFSFAEFKTKVAKFVKNSFDNIHGFNTARIEFNKLKQP